MTFVMSGWELGEEAMMSEGRVVSNAVSSQREMGLFSSPSISNIVQVIPACWTISITIASSSTSAFIATAGTTIPSRLC